MSGHRYTSSSFRYSSTGEDDSNSSTRRSTFRSGLDDSEISSSSVSRSTRITSRTTMGDNEPEISTFSTTRHSTRLSSEDDSFGAARRALDDDSTSRLSRRLLEDDDAFSSKRTKVEVEGGMSGFSMRSTKVTTIDSSGEMKSFESSSKQVYNASFGGGDTQMLEDSSPIGSIYVAILDYKPLSSDEDGLLLKEGEQVKVLDTSKPRKWRVVKLESGESGWVGSYCLEKAAGAVTTQEPATPTQEKPMELSLSKKETLVKELVDTEEDFARDMTFVVENYMREMDTPSMPKRLREYKEQLFYNFKEICNFHNEQLITGIKYNAREPSKLGTTLLRMERDFDKHVKYAEHESKAQQLLKDVPELKEYLDAYSRKIGDEKTIEEHLKLPLQRINDYQLILKELIKCNAKAGEDYTDLQRALDFMQAIPQRSTDLEFINKMEGYSGNIQKFGRILKETSETNVTEEAGSLRLDSKTEGQIVMKIDNKEEWSKQLQASTIKSEVAEKMSAEEELRVREEEDFTRTEAMQEDEANRTTTGVSDLEPRGTSPVKGEKPKFIQTLRGVSIHQNESATLECVIESEPAPALKWLKNNVPVRRGPRITQFSDEKTGRHSLTVTNAQPEDAAMYTIVASNPSGTTSCSAPFNVRSASGRPDSRPTSPGGTELPFAPVFKVKLKDTELLEGTSVRFELVVHGCPHPEVTFYKDGEPLLMDERIRVHYENKEVFELIIDHVTEADSAVYSCVAMNSEGCDSTAGCITVTKNKVLFQGLPEDGNAGDKSTTPQPTASPAFTWFKDGREFEASERFQVAFNDDEDTLALVFQHVKPEDAGIYTCVASTFSGKISCSAELTVQGTVNYREPAAPTIEANMEDVEVNEGASAMLELKITGWPKPRIVWTKGEKLIESGHGGKYKFLFEDDESMTLVIRSVTKEDGGRYDVVAENELGSAKAHCNLHVKCPPKFRKELKDASVMTETPLKLDVEVDGVPAPDVKWYKDGQQVTSTERVKLVHEVDSASYALLVDKAKTEDAGSYTCVISNNLGSQSGHAAVTVNSAPKIIKKLESYEATLTETVTFTTKVSGSPKPTVEWLKDGKAVVIDGKKYIAAEEEATVYSLTVDCCGPDDVGAYTVVVKNEFGKAEDSAELTIKIKPKFAKGLEDRQLVEGEVEILLNVVVEGKPEPTISWFHDGIQIKDTKLYATKEVTDKGEYTLVIKEAVAEAGGKFQCKAENKHGKAETEAKVTVNAKPKITEGLKDQSVVNGADATFTVKYAGSPKPEARWLKDDAEIQIDGKHYRVSEAEAQFTLVIKECKDDDKGRYKCVVENKFGKDESSAELKVLVSESSFTAPIFIRELENVCCKISERVVLVAETESNPEATPRWTRNHVEIVDSAEYEISSSNGVHKLIIKESNKSNVGNYTLEVANAIGCAVSSAEVSVYAPPEFIEGLKDIEATHGESVSFIAVVSGIPEPEITWKRNSETVQIDSVIQGRADGEVKILIIDGASRDHQGIYECIAKNPYGEVSSKAELNLHTKPRFILKPTSVLIRRREQAIFRAKVSGDPEPNVTWLKDGVAIQSNGNVAIQTENDVHSLLIKNCGDDDAATYTCVAKNEIGEVAEPFELKITLAQDEQSAPSFLRKPQDVITIEGEDICIEAHIVGNPQPQVRWLKNGIREVEETKCVQEGNVFSLVLNKVKQDDEASYTCIASNPLGSVQESASLTIKIPQAPTIEYFEDQQSSVGERIKFSVIVKGTPTPSVTWLRNGSTVEETSNVSLSSMDDSHSLTVKEVTILDFATYSLRAANLAGEAEATANLTEKARRPRVELPLPSKTTVKQGEPVLLEVKFSGVPNPTIIWLKNGDELGPRENLSICTSPDGASALKLDSPILADAGSYCVMAENPLGKSSSRCELGVIPTVSPLAFELPLKSVELPLGKPAKLEAKLNVNPDGPQDLPEITWFKDGLPIGNRHKRSFNPIDGSMALYIDNVSPVDSGVYAVTAEIENVQPASSSAPIHVVSDVRSVPTESPNQASASSCVGNEEQPTEARAPLQQRAAQEEAEKGIDDGARSPSLPAGSVQQEPSSLSSTGDGTEDSAPLVMLTPEAREPSTSPRLSPALISDKKENDSVSPGPPRSPCKEAESTEVKSAEHGALTHLRSAGGVIQKPESAIKFDALAARSEDPSECVRKPSDASEDADSEAPLRLTGTSTSKKPIFLWKLEPMELPVGECIKLQTKVTLNDDGSLPEIDWRKDGAALPQLSKTTASVDGCLELRVPKARLQDSGVYRVSARNECGQAETSSSVTLLSRPTGAPLFLEELSAVRVSEGSPLLMSTRVTLDEEGHLPLIEWFKDGQRVDSDRCHRRVLANGVLTLSVDLSEPQDAGSYLVRASNADGEAETSAPATVVSALRLPEFAQPLSAKVFHEGDDGKIEAKVSPNEDGSLPDVSWLKNGQPLKIDDHIVPFKLPDGCIGLKFSTAELPDVAQYTAVLTNPDGNRTESSAPVEVAPKSKAPRFEQALQPLEVDEGGSGKISGKVRPNEDGSLPTVSWLRDGRPLDAVDEAKLFALPDGTIGLQFSDAKPSDAANYTAVLRNPGTDEEDQSSAPVHVSPKAMKKPSFAQGLKPAKFGEGEPGRLEAKLNPNEDGSIPDVEWLKDGKPLTEADGVKFIKNPDGTVALEIPNCKPTDAGKYTLRAKNPDGGSAESSAPAEVLSKKPIFESQLKGLKLTEGEELKLVCKVKSETPITARWFKDGKEVPADKRVALKIEPDGTVILVIANCAPEDAGKYRCEVTNQCGTSPSEADVTVQALKRETPMFIDGLKATALDEGKPGKLEAKVSGFPKPEIQWLKDGKPVSDPRLKVETKPDGTTTLNIDDVKPADAGEYAVVAKNDQGENKSSAPVTVNEKPSFLKPLQDCTVPAGQTARFTSQVAGTPKPKIEWLKDGKPIKPDGKRVIAEEDDKGNCSLTLKDCSPADAGLYAIKASNPMGEMRSDAPLGVQDEKAPVFLSPLKDQAVAEGSKLVLEAKVMGTPAPEVKWFKNGKPVTGADNGKVSFDGETARIEIPKAAMTDAGQYECRLVSPSGEQSSKADVKVLKPPKFIKPLSDTEVKLGAPLVLECEVLCDDEPEISWTYRGAPIHDGAKYTITKTETKCKLFIANPSVNDCGEFQCTAKNAAGKDSTVCKGTIKETELKPDSGEPPSFLKKLSDQELLAGSTAKLIACIAGKPEPDVKWYKDGVEVVMTDRHSFERDRNGIIRLVIKNLEGNDFGEYRCEISNSHGKAECCCKLSEDSIPPSIDDAPDIVRMTDHDCTLRWKPSVPKGPRTPVTYRIEMCDHPGGAWKPYATGIKDTTTDVKGLRPGQDYQFRVLVESKHGLSEPSPPVTAHRSKLVEKDDKDVPEKEFKPKDIDLGHDLDKDGCAPYFVRKEEEVMFGVKGRPVSIEFWVYGLPHPECTWYFKDEKIESGGRYEKIQDRNGQVLLCINRMHEECEGIYTCKAVNVHGEATKSIRLELAEEPHFTKRLEYTTIMLRQSGTLQCRCVGKPYPNIRWYKDWLPVATSGRTKISWEEPDLCIMKLDDSIMRDAGLYSCKATNIAGDATCSATVLIEQEEELYDLSTYKAPRVVRPRTKPFRDYYDLGEELGRGTQGVTYHAVARATGNSYAAKVMHHKDPQFKQWMKNEMDTMNQLAHPKLCRMWDAFESPDSMSLVMDLCGGGELLNNIVKRGGVTEGQVANYVRQTLQGLDYMHARGIAHLGLTLGDLLVARVDADDIKIGDFSLATRIHNDRNFVQEYGHPEYVAPELAKKEPAKLSSDMWSVGVITYILLSGVSPFLGEHDRETLSNIKDGKMSFLPEGFDGVSDDARDFVAKLMVFEPEARLNVKAALNHPWLKMADLPDRGPKLGNYERLLDYQEKWRKWYANANCRTCFRRRTLESCFYHPSKMIYPPGEPYTPPDSPADREREHVGPGFNYERKKRKYDTENFKNESNYAQGPDTYLLQLRDTDFPLRLRQYMKVGASRSPSLAASLRGQHWGGSDIFARGQEREHIYPQVVIRERRKFHDMMDEEIDDEKKGGDDHKSILLRLNKEVGAVGYIKNQTDAVRDDAWRFRGVTREEAIGTLAFFREKIDDAVIMDNNNVSFTAVAVGTPLPQFTWFRNDCPLIPTSRIKIDTDEAKGTSVLTLAPGMAYDAGVFKCVARNASGTAVCRARLRMGDTPGRPAAPKVAQATSTQMYVEWNAPRQENNARTLFFTLEYKKSTDAEWQRIPERITNEFYIVEDLQPGTKYEFTVTATNSFGNSVTSDASKAVATEPADSTSKIKLSPTHSYQQVQTTDIAVGSAPVHDYSREQNPIPLKTSNPKDEYNFSAELSSGRFSVVMSATSKANSRLLAVKAVKNGKREYDMLKGLVHRNIVYLEDAFQNGDITLLVMERLSMNILAFLTLRNTYTEDQVSRVMKQVLDALEYLHFKGLVFCNVEPDSVCVTDGQSCVVKLVDFGSTHAVPKGGAQIAMDTEPEYMAPEVVRGEPVTYAADVWSAGVLMYILLSGVSPFLGATEAETRENVSMVRFHFESIYKECSSEATKLLIQVFKKCPTKRATIEECYENRWMLPSEYMLRKREACVFQSEKLAQFAQNYERAKRNRDNACMLLSNFGLNRITSPEA